MGPEVELTTMAKRVSADKKSEKSVQSAKPLSTRQIFVALLDATGLKSEEIALQTGYSVDTISRLRQNPLYVLRRDEFRRQIEQGIIERAIDLGRKFDLEAHKAFETLRQLCKSADSDAVRLNAAKDILDRAPNAPKARKITESPGQVGLILQIGAPVVEGMKEALSDVGENDVLELIEGKDYNVRHDEAVGAITPVEV